MTTGAIQLTLDGAVARVVVSNPARHNAMSLAMWQQLGDIIAAVNDNQDVRVVLLRGDGAKAFVSGADISEFGTQRANPESVKVHDLVVERAQTALVECAKPVVACIHGICMGGGLGIAAACDLRYAARDARFRMPPARLGIGYSFDMMRHVVDVVGAARAAELFYTARTIDGIEAERIGLVHSAYDDAELDDVVEHMVATIVDNAPLTISAAKLAIRNALSDPDGRDIDGMERALRRCAESSDYAEGQRAFMEKRRPRFTGR